MGGIIWWTVRRGLRSTPWRVVRILLEGRSPYEVELGGGFRTTWNPSKPLGENNGLSGPGVGIYRLDESGEVHLTWTPKGGEPRELWGPIPDRVRPDSEQTVRMRRMWHQFVFVYLTTLVLGFVSGFVVAGGSIAHQLAGGGIGLFVAIIVLAVGGTALSAIRSFRLPPARSKPNMIARHEDGPDASDDVWRRVEHNERIARRYLDDHKGSQPPPQP